MEVQASSDMKRLFFYAALMMLFLASCTSDKEKSLEDKEYTIEGITDTEWTYFSFESGTVVGRSSFLSEEEDAAWADRGDWDFAICGNRLRTNGGDSGKGLGGVVRNTTSNYYQIDAAYSGAYLQDSFQTITD